jgi:hypothetical protein
MLVVLDYSPQAIEEHQYVVQHLQRAFADHGLSGNAYNNGPFFHNSRTPQGLQVEDNIKSLQVAPVVVYQALNICMLPNQHPQIPKRDCCSTVVANPSG